MFFSNFYKNSKSDVRCRKCGFVNEKNSFSCIRCGHRLNKSQIDPAVVENPGFFSNFKSENLKDNMSLGAEKSLSKYISKKKHMF